MYNTNSQIKFKASMLKSSLYDYSDVCILVKEITSVRNTAAADADANYNGKNVILKNSTLFSDCISETNITQIGNAKDIDNASV